MLGFKMVPGAMKFSTFLDEWFAMSEKSANFRPEMANYKISVQKIYI